MARFSAISADPYQTIAEWKQRNARKVIAIFPMHIPEEIVHAAGMLPVVAWRGNEPVTEGHAHVPPFNCGIVRSFVDDAVRNKLSFLDGMAFFRQCLQEQSLPFIIGRNARPPYMIYLYLPAIFADRSGYPAAAVKDMLITELERFKASLEGFSGHEVTAEALNQSINIYNQNRRLLRELYELRRDRPGALRAREVLAIVHASMLMPKEEHNRMMEQLLPQLRKRKAADKRIKVVLAGSLCQIPQLALLDMIEDLGMEVVDDDMYIGSRYFANDVAITDKPIEALAERYLQRVPPCPTKGDWETDWGDYLVDMVKRDQAQGIINLLVKFCPPHLCGYPDVKYKIAEAGIPEVLLELEHEVVSLEQVRTRLQTLREIIGGV